MVHLIKLTFDIFKMEFVVYFMVKVLQYILVSVKCGIYLLYHSVETNLTVHACISPFTVVYIVLDKF